METHHMKMIYEAFCESLDNFRPYGNTGKPLPWKINPTKLIY